jgi:hypothetical protein
MNHALLAVVCGIACVLPAKPQQKTISANGTVTEAATAKGLRIQTAEGGKQVVHYYHFTAQTQLFLGDRAGKVEDFAAGKKVTFLYAEVNGRTLTAIRAEAPETPAGDKQQRARELQAAIARAKADIAAWEKELAGLEGGAALDPKALKVGDAGRFSADDAKNFKVVQVLDSPTLTLVRFNKAGAPTFLLDGVNNKGWFDGGIVSLPDRYEAVGTIFVKGMTYLHVKPAKGP